MARDVSLQLSLYSLGEQCATTTNTCIYIPLVFLGMAMSCPSAPLSKTAGVFFLVWQCLAPASFSFDHYALAPFLYLLSSPVACQLHFHFVRFRLSTAIQQSRSIVFSFILCSILFHPNSSANYNSITYLSGSRQSPHTLQRADCCRFVCRAAACC